MKISRLLSLHNSRSRLRRFVPPWEQDGKGSADDFFAGLFTGTNPLVKRRKQLRQQQEEDEAYDVHAAEVELEMAKQQQAMDDAMATQLAQEARQRDFLPYGTTPRSYFETNQLAAWGVYRTQLDGAATQYSPETRHLLRADMDSKLPYRYQNAAIPAPSPNGSTVWPLHGSCGVVLDIDGVVSRGGSIIEGSDVAIQEMMRLKMPVLFMTNGGGKSEAAKAVELSELLQCDIATDQVLLAHTPMSLMAERYADDLVLIGGGPACAEVARGYGFKRAKSMVQFQAEHPELVPLKVWHADEIKPAPRMAIPFEPVAAIFQFADTHDAFSDIQVTLDVLTSPYGLLGGGAVCRTQTVPLYYGADDLVYSSTAPLPRLGGGAYREMLASVFESITGNNLHVVPYGKPRAIAYAFAEHRMRQVTSRLGWDPDAMQAIAMVGDNPDTDIIGANARGGKWLSVQVLSGVGNAAAARRTLSHEDVELEWMTSHVPSQPHYIAPTLDHFVRELLAFPQDVTMQHKAPYHGVPSPVLIQDMYNLRTY